MRKKSQIKQQNVDLSALNAQLNEAERKLADKEAVVEMYRSLYGDLLDRIDALNAIVQKKLGPAISVKLPAKGTVTKLVPRKK